MTETLKPCPFCGSDNIKHGKMFSVYCKFCINCGAEGPSEDSEQEAADAWNRRTGVNE